MKYENFVFYLLDMRGLNYSFIMKIRKKIQITVKKILQEY